MTNEYTKEELQAIADKVTKARIKIIRMYPFYASIMLKHPFVMTNRVPTAAVDNKGRIYFNPAFVDTLDIEELIFLTCHEIMHVVYAHRLRVGNKDPEVWNTACDAVINRLLVDTHAGKMPEGGVLIDGVTVDDSADKVYEELMKNAEQDDGNRHVDRWPTVKDLQDKTPETDNPNGSGSESDESKDGEDGSKSGPDPDKLDGQSGNKSGPGNEPQQPQPPTEEEIQKAIADGKQEIAAAANAARMQGNMSASLAKFVGELLASKLPWHKILERYFTSKAEQRITWNRPNKRYAKPLYMPRHARFPTMGSVVVGVDTSGSITDAEIKSFLGHIDRICGLCHPQSVDVLYTCCSVEHHEHYEDCDYPIEPQPNRWCGGTDMRANVKWAEENCPDADLVVIFTDGYTPFVRKGDTNMDVLWVITDKNAYRDVFENESIRRNIEGEAIFVEEV